MHTFTFKINLVLVYKIKELIIIFLEKRFLSFCTNKKFTFLNDDILRQISFGKNIHRILEQVAKTNLFLFSFCSFKII